MVQEARVATTLPQIRPSDPHDAGSTPPRRRWNWARRHALLVPLLLAISATLAVSSLVGDSLTFDETSHLAAGMSYLKTGDFRLAPDHPPLAKIWATWPLLMMNQRWPDATTPGWTEAKHFVFGCEWLCELNDPDRLVTVARCMQVVLLLATCLAVYGLARTLFGPAAGLLALTLAAFDPTLLAHGRLVTTDMALTLCATLVLLTFARLMQRITWTRLLAAAAALAALTLTKFSWPVVLVGPLVMLIMAIMRPQPPTFELLGRHAGNGATARNAAMLAGRPARLAALGFVIVILGATSWAAIWTAYGWRYSMLNDKPRPTAADARAGAAPDANAVLRKNYQQFFDARLAGSPHSGPLERLRLNATAWARAHHLLPEAYLFGFTSALHTATERKSYLMGEYSDKGWAKYFPIAFAIKTPAATMLLLIAGVVALLRARLPRGRAPLLLGGMVAFALLYALTALTSHLNIGHRHLLPLYPVVFALAGAAAAWWTRPGRFALLAAVAWLVGANLWIHPHYLSYFNELIGGPAHGHEYLADSNIDWGQDLKRLAAFQRRHPQEAVQLAYFGSAVPAAYGVRCAALPSYREFGAPAELTAGWYVISVTQLVGVYDEALRDGYWQEPRNLWNYRELLAAAAQRRQQFEELRRKRLINRLQHRAPDERIGYSLFAYHLSAPDVEQLTRP